MKRTTNYKAYSYSQGHGHQCEPDDDDESGVCSIYMYKDTNCKRISAQGGSHKYANDIFQLSQMTSKTDLYQRKRYTENALDLLFLTESHLISNR